MANLDLNKLPTVSDKIGLLKYEPFDEFPELLKLDRISERIYGCNHFVGSKKDEKYPEFAEKAHLRAALNELVSISEMLKEKYPHLVIDKTDLPLLHFLKELRVSNFHLKTVSYGLSEGEVALINSDGVIGDERYSSSYFVVSDCNLRLFSDNDNYKKYYKESDEFHRTVEWVTDNQKTWGISHIVELALRQYCGLIQNAIANKT